MSEFTTAAESEWGWTGGKASIAIDLVFVRDVPVERVIEALGMDPAAATLIPRAGDDKPYQYMFHDDRLGATYVPWIRAGRAGEWVFVISPFLAEVAAVPDAVRELPRGGGDLVRMEHSNGRSLVFRGRRAGDVVRAAAVL